MLLAGQRFGISDQDIDYVQRARRCAALGPSTPNASKTKDRQPHHASWGVAKYHIPRHVTVTGSSPTGTVQFEDGATNVGAAVPLSGGIATLAISTLSVGTHSITALYSGDANNAGSTSSPVNEVISAVPAGGAVSQPIPTLSEGALGLLALLIGAAAMAYSRKRMR